MDTILLGISPAVLIAIIYFIVKKRAQNKQEQDRTNQDILSSQVFDPEMLKNIPSPEYKSWHSPTIKDNPQSNKNDNKNEN